MKRRSRASIEEGDHGGVVRASSEVGTGTDITVLLADPDVGIIAVSGVNSSEIVRTARDLGAARFLAKPYSAEVLPRALHDLLGSDAEPGTFMH